MTKMHENEQEITLDLIHSLINKQCPQWKNLEIKPILSNGTDNALFRLGEHTLFVCLALNGHLAA